MPVFFLDTKIFIWECFDKASYWVCSQIFPKTRDFDILPQNKKTIKNYYEFKVNFDEACIFLKISKSTFYRLIDSGVLPRSEDGLYKLGEIAESFWTNDGGNNKTLQEERTRLTKAQADLAEIELAEQRGELLSAQAVLKVWSDDVVNAKTRLLAIPVKIAPELVGQNLQAVQAILKTAIHEALKELSEYDFGRIKNAATSVSK